MQNSNDILLSWNLSGKDVVVIGGNASAAGRIERLVRAEAALCVICSSESDEQMSVSTLKAIFKYQAMGQLVFYDRDFDASVDFDDGFDLAVVCVDGLANAR